MNLNKIRSKLTDLEAERRLCKKAILKVRHKLKEGRAKVIVLEESIEILRTIGLKTQETLQYHISDITSMALQNVFGDEAYEVKVDFVRRRGKIECDIMFVRNGQEFDPIESSGYGTVDVAAFALRVASFVLLKPSPRPIVIMDEPMRFLSNNYQNRAGDMIKQVSERLGIQFIIVTHEEDLAQAADKVFIVSIQDEVSQIKVNNGNN